MSPLWNYGAQAVDVGFSGDKVEVVVAASLWLPDTSTTAECEISSHSRSNSGVHWRASRFNKESAWDLLSRWFSCSSSFKRIFQ